MSADLGFGLCNVPVVQLLQRINKLRRRGYCRLVVRSNYFLPCFSSLPVFPSALRILATSVFHNGVLTVIVRKSYGHFGVLAYEQPLNILRVNLVG